MEKILVYIIYAQLVKNICTRSNQMMCNVLLVAGLISDKNPIRARQIAYGFNALQTIHIFSTAIVHMVYTIHVLRNKCRPPANYHHKLHTTACSFNRRHIDSLQPGEGYKIIMECASIASMLFSILA